jgi:hypothetical protein
MRLAAVLGLALLSAAAARTATVTPEDDFRDSLAALSPGDTLYLLPGTYTAPDSLPLLHVLPGQAGVTITTSPDQPALLDGQGYNRPVLLLEGTGSRRTRVELVEVMGGAALGGEWFAGGGAFLSEASVILFGCSFRDNTAFAGGAVAAEAGSQVIQRCTFTGNSSLATGGGVNLYACEAMILDCRFTGNSCPDDGGALNSYQSSVTLRNVLMADNEAGDDGGGMTLLQGSHILEYVTLDSNSCGDDGGGILFSSVDSAQVTSCIVTGNSGNHGITGKGSPDVEFLHCCAWGNEIANYCGWEDPTGTAGNISQDPLYADTLRRLSHTAAGQPEQSPCVDAGHEAAAGSWIEGYSTRTDSIPDSLTADMGYHWPDSLQTGPGGGDSPVESVFLFPSPFRGGLRIRVRAASMPVQVRLYDAAGRLVWEDAGTTAGSVWSGWWSPEDGVAAGVYLALVRVGDSVHTGKVVYLR